MWNTKTRECVSTLEGHQGRSINSVSSSMDGNYIISGSSDKTVKVWDMKTYECVSTLEGHQGYVSSVTCSMNGKYIISGSLDKTVRMWDMKTYEVYQLFKAMTHMFSRCHAVWMVTISSVVVQTKQ